MSVSVSIVAKLCVMKYLSPEIEALAKKNKKEGKSLIKRGNSCGIFQDYKIEETTVVKEEISL